MPLRIINIQTEIPKGLRKCAQRADKNKNGKLDTVQEKSYFLTLAYEQLKRETKDAGLAKAKFVELFARHFLLKKYAAYQSKQTPQRITPQARKYREALLQLARFLMGQEGNPPNATKTVQIAEKTARAAYHVYEDHQTHLGNGGATTSEAQALFFGFMSACFAATGNNLCKQGAQEANNYIRFFMTPHDGWESPQLPDSRLNNNIYMPRGLMHWLIDISGKSKDGNLIFAPHTTYKKYGDIVPHSCLVLNPQTNLPYTKELKLYQHDKKHIYKFSSATDADQWFFRYLNLATQYGVDNYNIHMENIDTSLVEGLMKTTNKGIAMIFSLVWGAGRSNGYPFAWKIKVEPAYVGYQTPNTWLLTGRKEVAKRIVKFLKAAQDAYQKKYNIAGPLMPVWNKKFTWQGPDPNTPWVGFQLRMFANLAHYYYLSGDPTAKIVLDKFYQWIRSEIKREKNGKLSLPQWLDKNSGRPIRSLYSPNLHGLLAQGLIYMAAKTRKNEYKQLAEELLNDLINNRQDKNGRTKGSFPESPNHPVDPNLRFAFRQAEAGIALALYILHLGSE